MVNESFVYEIVVENEIPEKWSDWLEGMSIEKKPGRSTSLTGRLTDQAALLGILIRLHDFNLTIVSVIRK
jgi:hypothetical protein